MPGTRGGTENLPGLNQEIDMTTTDTPASPSGEAPAPIVNEFLARLAEHRCKLETVNSKAGQFFMRQRTGGDRYRFGLIQAQLQKDGHTQVPPALVVAWALLDDKGEPLFKDLNEGYLFCNALEGELLLELYNEALRITGIGGRSFEDAEKKS
jgi:hypothetical protein